MDVEWWKSFFEIGGVALLFLTFAFGAGFMITGKVVNDRQSEQLRKFEANLTGARTELGKQQERAARAERDAADAKSMAANVNDKALRLEAEAARARERAAKA